MLGQMLLHLLSFVLESVPVVVNVQDGHRLPVGQTQAATPTLGGGLFV